MEMDCTTLHWLRICLLSETQDLLTIQAVVVKLVEIVCL